MNLVTGATGFLGGHLVDLLLQRGERVRVFCRSIPKRAVFDPSRVEFAMGDITDPRTLPAAIAGIRRVYHVAGKVDFNPPSMTELLAVNEQGTRNVLSEARRQNVERVVHVSSVSTLGAAESFDRPLNESDFGKGRGTDIPYPRSKLLGERVALEFAGNGLSIVIANPTFFAGPFDLNLSSARTIVSFLRRQVWVGLTRGGMGFTDVRDVAAGLISAMDRGRSGERYILGGHNLRLHEYHAILEKLTGLRAPRIFVPPAVAVVLATIGSTGYRMLGIEPFVGPGDVRLARQYWVYDYSKAQNELGLHCRSPEESLRETLDWLKDYQR